MASALTQIVGIHGATYVQPANISQPIKVTPPAEAPGVQIEAGRQHQQQNLKGLVSDKDRTVSRREDKKTDGSFAKQESEETEQKAVSPEFERPKPRVIA